jgi:murein DD-endopeptidase MepM/ murein hydrolase activator NlpD
MWYKIAKFNSEVDNLDNTNDPDSLYGAMTGYIFSIKQKTSDLQKISDAFRSYKNKLIAEDNFNSSDIISNYNKIVEENNLPTNDDKSDTNNDTGELNFKKPLDGSITSNFGPRDAPMDGASTNHQGIDIDGNKGDFVIASESGTVTHAGPKGSYGNLVIIDHGGGYETYYAHLSSIDVRVDEEVMQNRVIGKVGKTGRATGPHLHFELRLNGSPVSPNF